MDIKTDDKAFRRWVSRLPCSVDGCGIQGVHPHHVLLRSRGGKDPDNIIPLCWVHHTNCHSSMTGMEAWARSKGLDMEKTAMAISKIYRSL